MPQSIKEKDAIALGAVDESGETVQQTPKPVEKIPVDERNYALLKELVTHLKEKPDDSMIQELKNLVERIEGLSFTVETDSNDRLISEIQNLTKAIEAMNTAYDYKFTIERDDRHDLKTVTARVIQPTRH